MQNSHLWVNIFMSKNDYFFNFIFLKLVLTYAQFWFIYEKKMCLKKQLFCFYLVNHGSMRGTSCRWPRSGCVQDLPITLTHHLRASLAWKWMKHFLIEGTLSRWHLSFMLALNTWRCIFEELKARCDTRFQCALTAMLLHYHRNYMGSLKTTS